MSQEIAIKLALQGVGTVQTGLKSVESGLGRLGGSLKTVAASAGGLAASLGLGISVGKLVQVQREFDVLNSSLKTVTGSSAAAEREMAWLKQFAKETPFGLAQATQGFVKMKALGLDPTRGALTSFGNTASAMGKDLNQMIEAVADASTGEFERLREFGIKSKKEGDSVSFTFQGVTTKIKNNAEEITRYLESLGNNQFAGAMAERAKTLDGAIAGLGDTWDELFRTVSSQGAGTLIYDTVTLAAGAIEDATTLVAAMGGAAETAGEKVSVLAALRKPAGEFFETVSVLAAEVLYVLRQTGDTMGGIAAGYKAFFSFDFAGARAIGEAMRTNAEAARQEHDALITRIQGARQAQEEYNRWATRNASAATDPRRVDLGGSAPRATTTSASSGAGRGVKETISEYDKLIKKLSDELPRAAAEAEAAQMGYNKSQTEFLALAGSPAWASFSNSQRAVVASMFEGKIASEQAGEAAKALSKSYAEAAAERIKTIQSMERAADSLQSQNDALREEIELIGLSTEQQTLVLQQRNDVIILTKEATLAELERADAISELGMREQIALQAEIAALKERNALLGAKGVKNASVDAAKTAKDEWQKTSDKITDTLTDALMRGFESGKDFAKNFVDTMKNLFKTMVLRPVISAIVNPVAGAVTGMMGLSGAAQAGQGMSAMGAAGNLFSAGSALGGLGAVGGAMSGFATAATASIQSLIGMSGTVAQMTTSLAAAGHTSMAGLSAGVKAFQAIPGWGWALAGVALLGSLAKKFDDSGTPHIGAGAIYSEAGGLQQGAGIYNGQNFGMGMAEEYAKGTQEGVSTIAKSLTQTFDGIAKAFGKTAGYEIATAFADDRSKDGALGSLRISQEGRDLLNWNDTRENKWAPREFANGEDGYKEYLAEIAKDTRTVLLDMDLPGWADTLLTSIGDAADMDALSAAVAQIGQIQTAFSNLGKSIEGFAGMSDKTFEALMKASGGLEALSSNAGSYYENFYSDAEKTAAVTRSVSDALSAVGLQMPATRDEFRALVESQLALGEEGAKASATLLGVSGAFASVVPAAADAAGAVEEMVSQITQNLLRDRGRLEADLLRAQGNTAGANAANRLLDIAGYTDAEMALYDYNAALRAQISGLEAASAAAEDARQRAMDGVDAAYSGLERSVGAQRSLVQETISSTREVFDTLRDNVRSLYGEVGSTAAMQAAQGRAFITQALSAAQTTGYLPEGKQLQEAIGAVRSEMQSKVYASQAEADYERLVLAGELKDLQDLSGDQLTEAEKQLKALDDILDNARSQVDALKGIDTSVISVEAAIQRLADALLTAKGLGLDKSGAASKAGGEYLAQVTPDMLKGYTQSQISGADNWTFGSREAITQAWQGGDYAAVADIVQRAGMSQSGLQNTFGLSASDLEYVNSLGITGVDQTKAVAGHDIILGGGTATNTGQSALFDSLALQAKAALAAGNEAGIYADAAARGLDSGDINALLGLPEGSAEEWARKAGLPVLRVGTNYVEEDGLHYLHKGEAVIPQPYNPAAGGAGNSTARLEALVEGLTKEVQRLQAVVNDGNREQRRTANAVNGNPDMPMLVQTV